MTLVVIDADVLGRRRTGDETYVANLLRELGQQADGLRLVALTRRPELVPSGIEPYRLAAAAQHLRMALSVPGLLGAHICPSASNRNCIHKLCRG